MKNGKQIGQIEGNFTAGTVSNKKLLTYNYGEKKIEIFDICQGFKKLKSIELEMKNVDDFFYNESKNCLLLVDYLNS